MLWNWIVLERSWMGGGWTDDSVHAAEAISCSGMMHYRFILRWRILCLLVLVLCNNWSFFCVQSVASRVSEEMGVKLGEEVGYTIRFEDITDTVSIYASCVLTLVDLHHILFLSSHFQTMESLWNAVPQFAAVFLHLGTFCSVLIDNT